MLYLKYIYFYNHYSPQDVHDTRKSLEIFKVRSRCILCTFFFQVFYAHKLVLIFNKLFLLLSACVFAAAQSNDGRGGIIRGLSCHGKDGMDQPGFCKTGWSDQEEYKGQQKYSPSVSQFQVRLAWFQHYLFPKCCFVLSAISCIKMCFMYHLLQHSTSCRSDSTSYRDQGPDNTNGIETGTDMTPPTPAFPISPPTPYGK